MRGNGLLKWLMIPVLLVTVVLALRLFSGRDAPAPATDAEGGLTSDEMKALGMDGDTPRDTVATLVAQVKQLRTELQTALADNKQHKAENERLRQREQAVDQRIGAALESERADLRREQARLAGERRQAEGLLADLQQRLERFGGKGDSQTELPAGLGLREGDVAGFGGDGLHWIEPLDAGLAEKTQGPRAGTAGPSIASGFGAAQRTLEAVVVEAAEAGAKAIGAPTAMAVYTVPANATLMGSIAMTALIGRVPVDGTVSDPYPFKVVVGQDNLTANGIDLPDIAGAVISGTASGDWTLSCVRGQVRSITFVFQDGTIRTLPEDGGRGHSRGGGQENLGWISDPYGIPCVSGERRSNAQQYLGTQALITAAGAGAASLIDADATRMSYAGADGSIGTVGIGANEAMGRILAGGVQDMSKWVDKLYGQAFAAVYVRPGAKVAVHLEQPLAIDHDVRGRRVNHLTGETHASDLD